jgi:hypothetical protein
MVVIREGRTETVRPVSVDSVAFVRAMENPEVSQQERLKLLQAYVSLNDFSVDIVNYRILI